MKMHGYEILKICLKIFRKSEIISRVARPANFAANLEYRVYTVRVFPSPIPVGAFREIDRDVNHFVTSRLIVYESWIVWRNQWGRCVATANPNSRLGFSLDSTVYRQCFFYFSLYPKCLL